MKRFLLLLCLLLLLTGCQTPPQPTTEPEATIPFSLLDHAEPSGDTGNLLYIPNDHIESMVCPQIRLCSNDLLLYEHSWDGFLYLKRISLADGSLLAEASYEFPPSAQVQLVDCGIGITDPYAGLVWILNDALELVSTFSAPQDGECLFLNPEVDTLYVFYPQQGLMSQDLATGQTQWLLTDIACTQFLGNGDDYVLFSYTDRVTQMTYTRYLDLSTAALETIPTDIAFNSGIRSGDQWLLRQNVIMGSYILLDQTVARTFVCPEGMAELLAGGQLMISDDSFRNLYLYDLAGNFLSHCALAPIEYASIGTDWVWNEHWQGYFFLDTYDNMAHLMFWDTGIPQTGENLSLTLLEDPQPPEPVLEPALYQRADELSQRFGVKIRLAEQCYTDYETYAYDTLTDPYFIEQSLDVLEETLSAYPEGFFQQLLYDRLRWVQIDLVANLRSKDGIDNRPQIVNGFAQNLTDYYLIALDGIFLDASTVYHEISHIIDKRLDWDASLRPEALFSEDTWLSLQPQGFRYAESYLDIPADVQVFEHSGYFVRSYGMTFPTEDRATLMALAIHTPSALMNFPAMVAKMQYYAACIRDCFNTDGWPEKTPWE